MRASDVPVCSCGMACSRPILCHPRQDHGQNLFTFLQVASTPLRFRRSGQLCRYKAWCMLVHQLKSCCTAGAGADVIRKPMLQAGDTWQHLAFLQTLFIHCS